MSERRGRYGFSSSLRNPAILESCNAAMLPEVQQPVKKMSLARLCSCCIVVGGAFSASNVGGCGGGGGLTVGVLYRCPASILASSAMIFAPNLNIEMRGAAT